MESLETTSKLFYCLDIMFQNFQIGIPSIKLGSKLGIDFGQIPTPFCKNSMRHFLCLSANKNRLEWNVLLLPSDYHSPIDSLNLAQIHPKIYWFLTMLVEFSFLSQNQHLHRKMPILIVPSIWTVHFFGGKHLPMLNVLDHFQEKRLLNLLKAQFLFLHFQFENKTLPTCLITVDH